MPSQPVSRIRLIQTPSFHGALTRQGTRPPVACFISWTLARPVGACSISIQSQSKPTFDKISATSVEPSVTSGPSSTSRCFNLVLKSSSMHTPYIEVLKTPSDFSPLSHGTHRPYPFERNIGDHQNERESVGNPGINRGV